MAEEERTYTIMQADGLYADDKVEQEIFAPREGQKYKVNYFSGNLWPSLATESKPWSDVPEHLRNEVEGITLLKLAFTEEDLQLFPKLKV